MGAWLRLGLILAVLLGFAAIVPPRAGGGKAAPRRDVLVRGAWLAPHGIDGFGSERSRRQMRHLRDVGFTWVAYAPEGEMLDVHAPGISWGQDDATVRGALGDLVASGLRVMVMPRIESPAFFSGEAAAWRGDVAMQGRMEWAAFHAAYESFTLHYARMAEAAGAELFCLGLEYRRSTTAFPGFWRRLARHVRAVFSGRITYSANWYREAGEITFWDALDYVGVGAYFPLAGHAHPDVPELVRGWNGPAHRLEALARRTGRPVLLTEIGYPAFADAGQLPYEWMRRRDRRVD